MQTFLKKIQTPKCFTSEVCSGSLQATYEDLMIQPWFRQKLSNPILRGEEWTPFVSSEALMASLTAAAIIRDRKRIQERKSLIADMAVISVDDVFKRVASLKTLRRWYLRKTFSPLYKQNSVPKRECFFMFFPITVTRKYAWKQSFTKEYICLLKEYGYLFTQLNTLGVIQGQQLQQQQLNATRTHEKTAFFQVSLLVYRFETRTLRIDSCEIYI